MKTKFSVIIVTWNGLEHLKRYLPSVSETDYSNIEIIIADNASDDGTREWVKDNFPICKVITFDRNFGYAGGNNRAVKYASGDVLVFLNNDAYPEPNWLQAIHQRMQNSGADIVQPKIRSANNTEMFEYAGAAGGMIDRLGYPFCRGRIFDNVEKDTGQYEEPASIFWASGSAFAIKKDLFLDAGGFDEDFEFHMEEIDLCWRCLKMGKTILYEPKSVVYHLGGGSMDAESPRKVFYNFRNSLNMLTKNLDRFLIPKIFLRLLLDGAAGLRFLLSGKSSHFLSILKAHFAYYAMAGKMFGKRRRLKKYSTHKTPENLVHPRLIIFEYFLRGKKTYHELSHKFDSGKNRQHDKSV